MRAPFVIEAKGWGPFSCYTEKSALDLLRDFISAQLDTGQENAGSIKQLEPRLYTDVELCEGPESDDPGQSCFCRREHKPDPEAEGLFQPTVIRFKRQVPLKVSVISPPEDYYLYEVEVEVQ